MSFVFYEQQRGSIFLWLLPLLLVTGCSLSMSKQEREKNVLKTPSIAISVSQAFDSQFFESSKWPEKTWWTAYGLQELNALIEEALMQNPSIQGISENIAFAKSQVVIARSKLFPLIYFDASDQLTHLSETGLYRQLNPDLAINNQLFNFNLSFTYEFDFWSKYRNLYRAALGREQAAIAETAQVELITAAALAQAYFALKTNLIRKNLYQELYQVRKSYFDLQALLLEKGILSQLEPLLSEEAVFEAQQYVYTIEQEIAVDTHIINILAGKSPNAPLEFSSTLPCLDPKLALPADISIELLSRRPDLMVEVWHMDALAHEVGAAKAEFWPDINLTGLLGFQSISWGQVFEWISKTAQLIPALSLPVYTAGAIGAHVSAKRAQFNAAVYRYNELILRSFQEIADLLATGQAVYGKKEEQLQIVQNASQRYELMLLRQNKGIDSSLTSYKFLEALIEKKLDDVQLLYQQYVISVSLTKALGGGYLARGIPG